LIVVAGLLYFLSNQIINFLDDAPELNKKLSRSWYGHFKNGSMQHIHINGAQQNEYIKETVEDIKDNGGKLVALRSGRLAGIFKLCNPSSFINRPQVVLQEAQ
jgi:hypothetical protein